MLSSLAAAACAGLGAAALVAATRAAAQLQKTRATEGRAPARRR